MTSLSDTWGMGMCAPKRPKRGPTPEGAFQKAAIGYLKACRLGAVKRVNVGQAWMGANPEKGYRGRPVKFGEVGHSDLVVESETSTRYVYVETKAPGWRPPQPPKPSAAISTLKKYKAHQDQVHFLERKRAQGHVAFFAQSLQDIYENLKAAGFERLPDPTTYPQGRR